MLTATSSKRKRSHGSVGSPFCTDYINSVLPVTAKLPLLMGCADCTKISNKIWSHGSVGSPFCTDYINSTLPVPAKFPLLMGCADCTKIGSKIWSHGSVGRAHRSHRWGHRFESCCDHHAPGRQKCLPGFFLPYRYT